MENHDAQLSRYFNSTPELKFGIITNGIKYKFFSDLKQINVMDQSPFFEINLENIKDEDINILSKFYRDNFEIHELVHTAEELLYMTNITNNLMELFNNPTDDFIRFLIKGFSETRITSIIVEKFRPIVKKAITNTILEIVKKGILLTDANIPALNNESKLLHEDDITENSDKPKAQIITTDEELNLFDITKNILSQAGKDTLHLKYKDTTHYFGILRKNSLGWFIRSVLKQNNKILYVKVPYALSTKLNINFNTEACGQNNSETKICLNQINDVYKLKDLIIKAYDLAE